MLDQLAGEVKATIQELRDLAHGIYPRPGFDAALGGQGYGYMNMADRLGAIGGTVRWESAPGAGTRVVGWSRCCDSPSQGIRPT